LKKNTDNLSAFYERKLEEITDHGVYEKWRESITNYTRVSKQFLEKFREGVMNGLNPNQ